MGRVELGCEVFWGQSQELTQSFPLRTLLDALRVGPGSADPGRAEIAELLWGRALVAAQSATPTDVVAAAAERLLVLVDRLCAVSPVVLVGDDLQWADSMSVGVWARLRAAVDQLPLLLVGVCRPVPARRDLVAARRGAGGDGAVLRLGELDGVQVSELVGRLVGAAPGPRLVGRAGDGRWEPVVCAGVGRRVGAGGAHRRGRWGGRVGWVRWGWAGVVGGGDQCSVGVLVRAGGRGVAVGGGVGAPVLGGSSGAVGGKVGDRLGRCDR